MLYTTQLTSVSCAANQPANQNTGKKDRQAGRLAVGQCLSRASNYKTSTATDTRRCVYTLHVTSVMHHIQHKTRRVGGHSSYIAHHCSRSSSPTGKPKVQRTHFSTPVCSTVVYCSTSSTRPSTLLPAEQNHVAF